MPRLPSWGWGGEVGLQPHSSPFSAFHSQAAYLVGVSDPNSQAGQQGLVDPTQFARANQAIQMACQNLIDPACTQAQVTGRGCRTPSAPMKGSLARCWC